MRVSKRPILWCATALALVLLAPAAALALPPTLTTYGPANSPIDLVNQLTAPGYSGLSFSSASVTGPNERFGFFPAFNQGLVLGQLVTLDRGIVIANGSVLGGGFFQSFPPGDSDLANLLSSTYGVFVESWDAAALEFDVQVPPGSTSLAFEYLYATQEYPSYVGTEYLDGAAIFVDGVNAAHYNRAGTYQPLSTMYADPFVPSNIAPYGGVIPSKRAVALLNPALTTHHVKIVVHDTGEDWEGNSAIYVSSMAAGTAITGGLIPALAPRSTSLSGSTVAENEPAGTALGTFSSTDPEVGDSFTYSLVSGVGATGNAYFQISGNTLETATPLDYETQSSHSIRVRTVDSGGACREDVFTIAVTDLVENSAPTDIDLTSAFVPENAAAGQVVGILTAVDPDFADTHEFSLTDDAGGRFLVDANRLEVAPGAALDFETQPSHDITVEAEDAGGLTFSKAFTIGLEDVNEAPVLAPLGDLEVQEGGSVTLNGTLTDEDAGDSHAVGVDWGDGSPAEELIAEDGSFSFDRVYGDNGSYTATVTLTDAGGLQDVQSVTVLVGNVSPTVLFTTPLTELPGGDFYLATVQVPLTFRAFAGDVGTDDLTFTWNLAPSRTYFNNGSSADPAQSALGTRPFSVEDQATVSFGALGVAELTLTASDDDGGSTDSLTAGVLVRGGGAGRLTPGFWRDQYKKVRLAPEGKRLATEDLLAYLELIVLGSSVFDNVDLAGRQQALALLSPGSDARADLGDQARCFLLEGWLNFFHGFLQPDERLDLDADGDLDQTVLETFFDVEQILGAPAASDGELREARQMARLLAEARTSTSGSSTTGTTLPTTPPTTTPTTPTTTPTSTTSTTLPAGQATFVDVPPSHAFFLEIEGLAGRGIVGGYAGGYFYPDRTLFRAQFAKMLVLALEEHDEAWTNHDSPTFADMPAPAEKSEANRYPFDYVEEAKLAGLVKGITPTLFAPYRDVTRVQLALMIARAGKEFLEQPPAGYESPFTDLAGLSSEAREAITLVHFNEIVSGKTATSFAPYATATRGHAAKMTWRLLVAKGVSE